jgi:hypothetical protein
MKNLLLCLVFLAFAGCARLTDAQAASLAQGRADVEAARASNEAGVRSALFEAAGARLMAGTTNLDLPAPTTSVPALVATDGTANADAVKAEVAAAHADEKDPPSGWGGVIAGIAGGLGLAALSVLRFSPGAFGLVANLAHTVLAPKATKDMRAVQAKAMDVAREAVDYGQALTEAAKAAGLGTAVDALQDDAARIQDKLGIRPEVQTMLAAVKARRASGPQPLIPKDPSA